MARFSWRGLSPRFLPAAHCRAVIMAAAARNGGHRGGGEQHRAFYQYLAEVRIEALGTLREKKSREARRCSQARLLLRCRMARPLYLIFLLRRKWRDCAIYGRNHLVERHLSSEMGFAGIKNRRITHRRISAVGAHRTLK